METQCGVVLEEIPTEILSQLRQLGEFNYLISSQVRTRRKVRDKETFKHAIGKLRKRTEPKLQLSTSALNELDKILHHIMDKFENELFILTKIRRNKVLTMKELEYATKLCLPGSLKANAMLAGRRAVNMLTIKI